LEALDKKTNISRKTIQPIAYFNFRPGFPGVIFFIAFVKSKAFPYGYHLIFNGIWYKFKPVRQWLLSPYMFVIIVIPPFFVNRAMLTGPYFFWEQMDQNNINKKKDKLITCLKKLDSLAIAFSGGVDSTFLLSMAYDILKENVVAITATSPIHPERETRDANQLAKKIGARHMTIRSREIDQPDFLANPINRCYVCKKYILEDIIQIASEMNIKHVAHGANTDDLNDFRPGFKAAEELGVLSPLIEAELTKTDIRILSKEMDLPTWNKPSNACLASRIPYETPITIEALSMIEQAEAFISSLGLKTCRVRHHGNVARIETAIEDMEKVLNKKIRAKIVKKLKGLGYKHISIDLEGYRQGSMN